MRMYYSCLPCRHKLRSPLPGMKSVYHSQHLKLGHMPCNELKESFYLLTTKTTAILRVPKNRRYHPIQFISLSYGFSAYWLRLKCLVCCQHIDHWSWMLELESHYCIYIMFGWLTWALYWMSHCSSLMYRTWHRHPHHRHILWWMFYSLGFHSIDHP